MKKELLIIFTKNPIEGKVKTRLALTMGKQSALHIYKQLLAHTFNITNILQADKSIFYSDFIPYNDIWKVNNYDQNLQQGSNLGERMFNAFESAFSRQYKKAVIIGSDCYELTSEVIQQAFIQLENHDAVIGPATDGGYYLLGLKQLNKNLFENITWSTSSVLNKTIEACNHLKLKYFLLPLLNDIDNEEDWIMHKNKNSYEG